MSSISDDDGSVHHNDKTNSDNSRMSQPSQNATEEDVSSETIAAEEQDEEDLPQLEDGLDLDLPKSNPKEDDTIAVALHDAGLDERVPVEDNELSSLDDSTSLPDDTPSIRESMLSSPGSRTPPLRSPGRDRSLSGSPSTLHRPFERRFQSRLSSYQLPGQRSSSPAFLGLHSRHSSITSLGNQTASEPDDSTAPWEVIRWTKLKKLSNQTFSEIGKRNFGAPTCLVVTDQIVIGTSKGMILVFDHQQNHQAIIGSGTQAAESGAITSLAISADHTTVAAGHSTGHIFTWEIARPARPFLHIQPIDVSQPKARNSDGHVIGNGVVHLGFLGYRHTALVSADDRGMAFSHLATRGMGPVGRVVRTTRILGRYPQPITRNSKPLKKSSVLAFSALPLGNMEQRTDSLGLTAMMTPYLLVIVSTTPIAQTQHKAARPKEVTAHGAMTAALAWFPAIKLKAKDSETSRTKLAYAWSNILSILDVHVIDSDDGTEKDRPPDLQFLPRSRYKSDEAIVAIQWLSRSVLAVLTITQQLLIIEDGTMNVTDSFDLLPKNIYHADLYSQQLHSIIENLDEEDSSLHGVVADGFDMSFRAYKGRLFLLGFADIWWGSLTNWADRLLALMNIGDFIGAIKLATRYYAGQGERVTIGLPEEDSLRFNLVGEKLTEMMNASLKYAFGKNRQAGNQPVEKPQMVELAEACISACLVLEDLDFLFDEVFAWYDDHDEGAIFVDLLEPFILDGQIISLPPPAVKTLINHFSTTHTPSSLEEIICLLDTTTMDLDQVTSLCKKYNLYDAYIYVWNRALGDYTGPLEELLNFAKESKAVNGHIGGFAQQKETAQKMFPYISFLLTSRIYPTSSMMEEEDASNAKTQIYDFFFSGKSSRNDQRSSSAMTSSSTSYIYTNLSDILIFDTSSFMSSMNEAFEDSFLNAGNDSRRGEISTATTSKTIYNRQYIVQILLEVMSTGFEPEDTIYLDMFIARNLPKYPQYILLSGTALQDIFTRLCEYPDMEMREDAQLSVEYLLSVYHPADILSLVPLLRQAGFYRVLKSVLRQEQKFAEVITLFFVDEEDKDTIFTTLVEFLTPSFDISKEERQNILEIISEHALELVHIDVRNTAFTIETIAPTLHWVILRALDEDPEEQYEYLHALLEPDDSLQSHQKYESDMAELYLRLMCQYNPDHVRDYVETIQEGDLRLEEVLPTLENTGIIDAAVILQVRQGKVAAAMERLVQHLSTLQGALNGLMVPKGESDDDIQIDTIKALLQSIDRYARVGIWLCQGQSKAIQRSRPITKSPKRSGSTSQALVFEENLWLNLIITVVGIARDTSLQANRPSNAFTDAVDDIISPSLRTTIQQVFTALLTTATSSTRDNSGTPTDLTFLRILRAFLSHAAKSSPSLAELRNVIASIFSAYAYEEALLALSNTMLDKDVFLRIDQVNQLRQKGWRPRGQVCEICRRRLWGPGIGEKIWTSWQERERVRASKRHLVQDQDTVGEPDVSRGKGKATDQALLQSESDEATAKADSTLTDLGPIVVFSCRHLYHQQCLRPSQLTEDGLRQDMPLSQGQQQLACPACV